VLFRQDVLRGIASGDVTLAFRRWRRPTVRAGGTLRTRAGVLAIETIDVVDPELVTDDDARRAGHENRAELLAATRGDRALHRVAFRLAGPDPRAALRERTDLSAVDRAALDARLARMDARGRDGPWSETVLRLIAERPATRAAELAAALGRDKPGFKADVRKLKELGLTESLSVGYRLSPRGRAYMAPRP
jgi:hypothetical protein